MCNTINIICKRIDKTLDSYEIMFNKLFKLFQYYRTYNINPKVEIEKNHFVCETNQINYDDHCDILDDKVIINILNTFYDPCEQNNICVYNYIIYNMGLFGRYRRFLNSLIYNLHNNTAFIKKIYIGNKSYFITLYI
jgi:hypothetical protein